MQLEKSLDRSLDGLLEGPLDGLYGTSLSTSSSILTTSMSWGLRAAQKQFAEICRQTVRKLGCLYIQNHTRFVRVPFF